VRKSVIFITFTAGFLIAGLTGCAPASQHVSSVAANAIGQTVASVSNSPTVVTCAKVAPIPAWLPPQAALLSVSCLGPSGAPLAHGPVHGPSTPTAPDQLVSRAPGQTVRTTQYGLSGSVNASTNIPNSPTGHFGTDILLMTYVGSTKLDTSLQNQYINVTTVTLPSGVTARLTEMANGYGPVRIEWLQGGNSYLLMSDHLINSDGTSGIPTGDLLKMASSIPIN
jgi:hypothetical protein